MADDIPNYVAKDDTVGGILPFTSQPYVHRSSRTHFYLTVS